MATINGRLVGARSQKPYPDLLVLAWFKGERIGDARSDREGSFSIEIPLLRRGEVHFHVLDGDKLLLNTEGSLTWSALNGDRPIVLPLPELDDPGDPPVGGNGTLSVAGLITNERGVATPQLRVEAWDRNVEGARLVAAGHTDADGRYQLVFDASAIGAKQAADLEVRVIDDRGEPTELARSRVVYQAPAHADVGLTVAAGEVRSVPEYVRLRESLAPVLRDHPPDKLNAEGVTYVAERSGWDARMVAMNAQAATLSAATGIAAEHYYALLRAGAPGEPEQLHRLSDQQVRTTLERALDQRVISSEHSIAETVRQHRAQAVNALRDARPTGAISTLGEMLAPYLDGPQQDRFIHVFREAGEDREKLWSRLQDADFGRDTIERLRTVGALGRLTFQNAPVVERLINSESVGSLDDLATAGFYEPDRWLEVIKDNVPKNVDAKDYATALAAQVNLTAPTLVAADLVRRRAVDVGDAGEELTKFLVQSSAEHRLGEESVRTWKGFDELGDGTREAALTVERLHQISPSNEAMVTLSQAGVRSAMDVAMLSESEFEAQYGEAFASHAQAMTVHRKSTQVHSTALNLATMYLAQRSTPNVYVITGLTSKEPPPASDDVVVTATLEDLFTHLDYCACEHCSSVFSPAAYLVELFELLDLSDRPHAGENPLEVLFERRPDLQHLLLSCENTNVALPYVDIVNEVLEHYVVNDDLDAFTGHDTVAGTRTADLLADPEFVQDTAYDALRNDVYPWSLPFDMPLAAMRLLFGAFDTTLADALEAFGATPADQRRERLGFNGPEYRIVTDRTFHALPEYFGEPAGATIANLNAAIANAKTFCRRADIRYEELAAILETRFVNPSVTLVPQLEALGVSFDTLQDWFEGTLTDVQFGDRLPPALDEAPYGGDVLAWLTARRTAIMSLIVLADVSDEPVECDFAQVELRFSLPRPQNQLTEIAYLRLLRFIRLWRKLGRSIEFTDELLARFSPVAAADLTLANIDATFVTLLDRIANFERLLAELDVSTSKVASWLSLWDTALDVGTRRERLAGLLRIGTTDLAHLCEITGLDPFTADMDQADPSLLRLARTWRELKASPLKVADLDYLLRDQDLTGKLAPPDATLLRDLKALRDALAGVESELGLAAANPDLAAAQAKMALVHDPVVVDRFFAFVSHSTVYSTPFVSAEETLPAALAPVELDPFARRLAVTGLMTDATQTALEAAADDLALVDFTEIITQADVDAFVTAFKAAVQALRDAGDADLASFAGEYPELGALVTTATAIADPAAKATAILEGILPELRVQLKARAVRTALATITKAEAEIVDALLAGAHVLHGTGGALVDAVDDFLALEQPVTLTASAELLLDPLAGGEHIVYVTAPPNTQVALELDGTQVLATTAVGASGEVASTVPVTLQAGTLTPLVVTLTGLPAGESARLRWRTQAIAKADIPAARLVAKARVDAARTTLLRIHKAVLLQRSLGLTAGELVHMAAVEPNTRGFLDALDTDGSITAANLRAQWQRIARMLWFIALKAEHEPDPGVLLSLLEDPALATPQGTLLLTAVMEWEAASLTAVLAHHGLALADLVELDDLRRVTRTMELVTLTGQPAADLRTWAVPAPAGALFRAAKAALKARMTEVAYRELIQPVSDALRNQRRDALVAHILFHAPPGPAITTPDRLYEHFLLDVQMDACQQTSRVRLALSTTQMFINRCLMNLESDVPPASIRTDHWQWMQRYRVWEAQRRVFVHPESYLEPELRDGKSPLFTTLEAELLKSDITDDAAEQAYLGYLKKLDDIAKLEVVASYLHERTPGNADDDVLHVFARTNGTTREYYSRRFEYGYWTPWEKVPLKIEGDLLIPVMWKSQLFVFWLTVLPKPGELDRAKQPYELAAEPWGDNSKTVTELTLNWGEYYRGKWTSPKSTEIKQPLRIVTYGAYDPDKLVVSVRTERPSQDVSERLIFSIAYISTGMIGFRVTFTSKRSAPMLVTFPYNPAGTGNAAFLAEVAEPVKTFNYGLFWSGHSDVALDSNSARFSGRKFEVQIAQPDGANAKSSKELVLTKKNELPPGFSIHPVLHPTENPWEAPFFYSDERSVFFVQGEEKLFDDIWFEFFYNAGVFAEPLEFDLPLLFEEPVIPDLEDPLVGPWKDLVNINYTKVLEHDKTFPYDGARFGAHGPVGHNGFPGGH